MMVAHEHPDRDYMVFFEHYKPVCIDLGTAAFANLSAEFLLSDPQPAVTFVIGSSSSIQNGSYNEMSLMMLRNHLTASIISGIPSEPSLDDVRRIVNTLKQDAPNEVVAIGGGSVIDAAKAAYLSYQTGLDVSELFGANVASSRFPDRKFKSIIAVPTTAGTGSEVTPYACIVDSASGVKRMLSEKQIIPRIALINPDYCITMPQSLTVSTAIDAMVHSIEALLNTAPAGVEALSDYWPVRAVELIVNALPDAVNDPKNQLAREHLSVAATLGGAAIAVRPTSLPHLTSFSLYGKLPHGLAVGLLLPPFWRYYAELPQVAEQTMKLAGIFPSASARTTPEDVISAAEAFIVRFSGVRSLASLDFFTPDFVKKIAADAVKNPVKLLSAPRPVSVEEAPRIIESILS